MLNEHVYCLHLAYLMWVQEEFRNNEPWTERSTPTLVGMNRQLSTALRQLKAVAQHIGRVD